MSELDEIRQELVRFRHARGWAKYHTTRNLAESVSIEAAELLELFQWGAVPDRSNVEDEIADVMIYCINLADVLEIDVPCAIRRKIRRNAERFPV